MDRLQKKKPITSRPMDQWRSMRQNPRLIQAQVVNRTPHPPAKRILSAQTIQKLSSVAPTSVTQWQKMRQQQQLNAANPDRNTKFSAQPVANCGPMPDYGLSVKGSDVDCNRFDCGPMPDYGPTVMPCHCDCGC